MKLSHSAKITYQRCNRLYFFKYVMKLEGRKSSKPLRMGSAFSDALEHWDVSKVNDYYTGLLFNSDEYFDSDDLKIESNTVTTLAIQYMNTYSRGNREVRFDLDSLVKGARYVGFIDQLDGVTLVENKLKGRFSDDDAGLLEIDDQVNTYVAAACEQLQCEPDALTILYRVTLKPALRRKVNESVDDFCSRISSEVEANPEKYQKEYKVSRTKDQIDDWRKETQQVVEQITTSVDSNSFPKNTGNCRMFMSNCDMLPICLAKNEADEDSVVLSQYKIRETTK